MGVLSFPSFHNFLLCYECEGSEWRICWPKDKELQWYIECAGCSQQYKQGLITGLETPSDNE